MPYQVVEHGLGHLPITEKLVITQQVFASNTIYLASLVVHLMIIYYPILFHPECLTQVYVLSNIFCNYVDIWFFCYLGCQNSLFSLEQVEELRIYILRFSLKSLYGYSLSSRLWMKFWRTLQKPLRYLFITWYILVVLIWMIYFI